MTITHVSAGERNRPVRLPKSGKPSQAGQHPDEFDEWLDRTLRQIFTQHPDRVPPPGTKPLAEPDQRQGVKPARARKTGPKAG